MVYVISRVIGDGQRPGRGVAPSEANGPFRPKAGAYGAFVAVIPPGSSWCLVKLVNEDAAALAADNDCRAIPSSRLDDILTNPQANVVNNWLNAHGAPDLVTPGMTVEQAINAIGDYLSPGWSLALPFSVGGL